MKSAIMTSTVKTVTEITFRSSPMLKTTIEIRPLLLSRAPMPADSRKHFPVHSRQADFQEKISCQLASDQDYGYLENEICDV